MKTKLPFVPVPIHIALKLSRPFKFFGSLYERLRPEFKIKLYQAEIDLEPVDYIAVSTFSMFFIFLLIFIPMFSIGIVKQSILKALTTSLISGFLISFVVFMQAMIYPSLLIAKKTRLIERDLLFALKYLLLKLKSGIPIYDAFVSVAEGGFGEVSEEFKKAAKEMASGGDALKALENMALRSPSTFLRRTIWQITNNVRAGSEITDVLESIIESLVHEQKILIRKYGAELNPIILMYMMATVVIPSLGITVLIVMGSFAGLSVPTYIFYIIPVLISVLQFFFITLVKNKRPMFNV